MRYKAGACAPLARPGPATAPGQKTGRRHRHAVGTPSPACRPSRHCAGNLRVGPPRRAGRHSGSIAASRAAAKLSSRAQSARALLVSAPRPSESAPCDEEPAARTGGPSPPMAVPKRPGTKGAGTPCQSRPLCPGAQSSWASGALLKMECRPRRAEALSRALALATKAAPRRLGPDPDLVRFAWASLRSGAALYSVHVRAQAMAFCSGMLVAEASCSYNNEQSQLPEKRPVPAVPATRPSAGQRAHCVTP